MKQLFALLVVALIIPAAQAQTTYKVDGSKATLKFEFVKDNVEGTVSGFQATIKFDKDNLSKSSITGTIDASTITTGLGKRDDHLKAKDYFDVKNYPVMSFKSTGFEATEKGYKMTGTLKIKNVEKPMVWLFTLEDNVFKARAVIKSKDFGIMDSDVRIILTVPVTL
jgi:polyisoprenoid-binding protein YceI